MTKFAAAAGLLLLTSMASAQAPLAVAPAQSAALVVGGPAAPMLQVGRPVPLRTLVELTTFKKAMLVGQRVPLEVAEPVVLNGQIIIPAGTPAVAEITMVRNKGAWGKSGAFGGRVVSMNVSGREIRMSGAFDNKGHAGGGAAVATTALVFAPAGFFMTGTSASLPSGAPITGFLAENIPVQLASAPAAVAPLQAQAPGALSALQTVKAKK